MAPLLPHAGRTYVEPPTLTPLEGGIFQAAEVLPLTAHQSMGVAYDSEGSYDLSTISRVDTDDCVEAAVAAPEGFDVIESEEPLVLNGAVKCWASGGSEEEYAARIQGRIEASEQREVEQWLWEEIFPAKAVDLTPGGAAVKPKRGLGILLEHAGKVYNFVPTVHFGKLVGVDLAGADLVKFDGDKASAVGGAKAVNGAGYFSKTGPGGVVAGANEAWLYVTGEIVIRRDEISTYPTTDHARNTRIAYGIRTYLATIDGFVAAIRITLE